MTRVHGWDLSLNHGGFIELDDGKLSWFRYVSEKAGSVQQSKEHGVRFKIPDDADRLRLGLVRLDWWRRFLLEVLKDRRPDYVGIEDYALEGGAHQAHYKGELGGVARLLVWAKSVPLRLHDPGSVKMFAAHNGKAGKPEMVEAVRKRWGHDFAVFNAAPGKPKAGSNRAPQPHTATGEDLADAFAVAQLVWTEVRLRSGYITTRDLTHEKEVQVFNRVTKAFPANLLDREWIRPGKGT